jgi:hypothetical protein
MDVFANILSISNENRFITRTVRAYSRKKMRTNALTGKWSDPTVSWFVVIYCHNSVIVELLKFTSLCPAYNKYVTVQTVRAQTYAHFTTGKAA